MEEMRENVTFPRACRDIWAVEVSSHPFLILSLDAAEWSTPCHCRSTYAALTGRQGGPQRRSGRFGDEKNVVRLCAEFVRNTTHSPRVVQVGGNGWIM
jgi:hypothetical protein